MGGQVNRPHLLYSPLDGSRGRTCPIWASDSIQLDAPTDGGFPGCRIYRHYRCWQLSLGASLDQVTIGDIDWLRSVPHRGGDADSQGIDPGACAAANDMERL